MKSRHWVLGALVSLAMLTMLDRVCISVAGKTIQDELQLSSGQWGWVLGIFSLAYGIFEVPGGMIGDRLGPRKVLTRIVLWWSAFTALTGAARGFNSLLLIRFFFGAGEAGAFPNMAGVVQRWFPKSERGRAQGVIWMASRLGGAISPVLVIYLQNRFGWRLTMQLFGALGFVWAGGWYVWFRDSPVEKRSISESERTEIQASAGLTSSHELVPITVGKLLAQPGLWWVMLMYYTYSWSGYFYQGWLFNFLRNGRGFDDAELLRFSWVPFVCGALANFVGGFFSDALVARTGLKKGRCFIGVGGLGLSALLLASVVLTQSKIVTVALLALGYAASDFMLPSAWAVCMDIGGKRVGTISGAMNMAGQLGGFSSSVVFGYIVGATGSYDVPLFVVALLTGCATILWLKIDPTHHLVFDA